MKTQTPESQVIPTVPFSEQRPGTSGLQKEMRVFTQPHDLVNFVKSVFEMLQKGNVEKSRQRHSLA